jgi:hypothetical protein
MDHSWTPKNEGRASYLRHVDELNMAGDTQLNIGVNDQKNYLQSDKKLMNQDSQVVGKYDVICGR